MFSGFGKTFSHIHLAYFARKQSFTNSFRNYMLDFVIDTSLIVLCFQDDHLKDYPNRPWDCRWNWLSMTFCCQETRVPHRRIDPDTTVWYVELYWIMWVNEGLPYWVEPQSDFRDKVFKRNIQYI